MLIAVMFLWASGVVVARSVHELVSPVGFSFWRWFTAAVILTPLAASRMWEHGPYLRSRFIWIGLLGLFMAGGSTALFVAVQYTTATNVTLLSATQPIATAVIAWFLLRDRLSAWQLVGIAAATAGIVAMIARLDLGVLRSLSFNPGDAVMLLSVSFYALYAVNLHRWISGVGPLLMMYVTSLSVAAVLLPVYAVESLWSEPMVVNREVIAATVFMAVVPTILATTMWNMSVGAVGPNRATIFTNLIPLFGIALAVLLLNESLHVYHIVGVALVCAGITLVVKRGT
jgi:drug/metabolite transporter (DMT)-like permease